MASVTKNKRRTKQVQNAITGALAIAQQTGKFSVSKLWVDFDQKADVLYISFKRPQDATYTVELDDEGILLRYRHKELVGITVLDASQR